TPAAPTVSAPGQRSVGVGGTPTAAGQGCVAPPGSDQGVTATQISLAIILVDIAGPATNSVAGYPSPAEQQQDYQEVMDSINASGGVACRKLVAQFYHPSPADQSALQQTCVDIQQAGVFSVIDVGAYGLFPSIAACFPQHNIPLWSFGGYIPNKLKEQYY